MTILGCPPKSKNFQKGTLGGSRFGQKGIQQGVQKRAASDFLAHCPPSEKRTTVATRNPSRKPSMLLSHKDYYCFLTGLSATGPRKTVCIIKFLTTVCQNGVHFWDPFFPLSALRVPKRAPEDLIRALVGSPGRLRRRQKAIWGGPKSVPKMSTQKEPKRRALRRTKTAKSTVRSFKIKVLGRPEKSCKLNQK